MANVCSRCKGVSSLALVKGEMLCEHCSPMKGVIDYHKKLLRLRSLKDDEVVAVRTSRTKQSSKMSSGKTLTIKRPQVDSSSVDRAKQVAKLMKTVVKKSK